MEFFKNEKKKGQGKRMLVLAFYAQLASQANEDSLLRPWPLTWSLVSCLLPNISPLVECAFRILDDQNPTEPLHSLSFRIKNACLSSTNTLGEHGLTLSFLDKVGITPDKVLDEVESMLSKFSITTCLGFQVRLHLQSLLAECVRFQRSACFSRLSKLKLRDISKIIPEFQVMDQERVFQQFFPQENPWTWELHSSDKNLTMCLRALRQHQISTQRPKISTRRATDPGIQYQALQTTALYNLPIPTFDQRHTQVWYSFFVLCISDIIFQNKPWFPCFLDSDAYKVYSHSLYIDPDLQRLYTQRTGETFHPQIPVVHMEPCTEATQDQLWTRFKDTLGSSASLEGRWFRARLLGVCLSTTPDFEEAQLHGKHVRLLTAVVQAIVDSLEKEKGFQRQTMLQWGWGVFSLPFGIWTKGDRAVTLDLTLQKHPSSQENLKLRWIQHAMEICLPKIKHFTNTLVSVIDGIQYSYVL